LRRGHIALTLVGMMGVFAEFEANLRRERQLKGIAKAKVAGVYKAAQRR
jgi:DNA invertase Pin-like site-specific DNA recombinase